MKKDKETCTWAVPNFPRILKNRFLALAKSQGTTGNLFLQFIIARTLREEREKTRKEIQNEK
jgi:hypothetical protein